MATAIKSRNGRRKVKSVAKGRRKVKPTPRERREVNSRPPDDAKSNPSDQGATQKGIEDICLADKVLVDERIKERDKGTYQNIEINYDLENANPSFSKHPNDELRHIRSNFNSAELVSMSIKMKNTLSSSQYLPKSAENAKMEYILH